ncbi:MAG TPA: LysE family transporter [Nitrososphaeraceae archaeon]|nr:LysE family transporter [Nitrososphaeraceae archaeon]
MILLDMGLQIILVSASGVLTPGPLFFANLALSKYGGFWSGIKIAIGHTIVELPLIILYSLPFIVLTFPSTIFIMFKVISIIGGVSLIVFGIFYVVRTLSKNNNLTATDKPSRIENPILAGILFTGVNPFFFLWWISVGIKLISDSLQLLGYPLGIVFLFFVHIWMDYAWLGLSSYFTSRGIKIVGSQYHKFIIILLTLPLFYYGINFILAGIR